jgi:hypothetical protein
MGNWGVKVTKKGKDITSTTVEDYVISSAYNTLKIVNEVYGEDLEAGDSFNIEETVTHNLGYVPQYRAYFYNSADDRWFVPPVATDNIMCGYSCDSTTFTLSIYTTILLPPPPADTQIKWKIYIFADPEGETWT